jgi:hypothetical protein
MRYYDPIRHPAGSVRLPVCRLYAPAAPDHRTIGAGEGFPSSRNHPLPIPLPLPRAVPRRLHFQVFSAFHGLRRDFSGSALPCPSHEG